MNNNIDWNTYAMMIAYIAALRSPDPYKKVGACCIDNQNRILATGYNGLASGKEVDSDFWSNRDSRRPFMIHAEMNALSFVKKGDCDTLASTLLPCTCCANLIAAHGVKRVLYSEVYDKDMNALEIFKFHNIELLRIPLDVQTICDTVSKTYI